MRESETEESETDEGRASEPPCSAPASGRWLLVTDIDDTLTGDERGLERFVELVERTEDLAVVLNSSRPLADVAATQATLFGRWKPDGLVGAMGTEIVLDGDVDLAWAERFAGWQRGFVDALMARLGHAAHPDRYQTPLKASYEVPAGEPLEHVRRELAGSPQPCLTVHSGGNALDVLPCGAGKGTATTYAAERLGVPRARVIAAGDSRNDLEMFLAVEKGIAVANATDELREELDPLAAVFTRRSHAGGLIEGLYAWGVVDVHRPRSTKPETVEERS